MFTTLPAGLAVGAAAGLALSRSGGWAARPADVVTSRRWAALRNIMLALRKPLDAPVRLERNYGGRQTMTTGDEPVGCEPTGYVPTGPLYSKEELEQSKPPIATGGELTGYENTGPLFSPEELEQHRPTRKRRKLDWATAGTVGTSLGIALAIVAAGVACGAAEGYSPGRILREIVHTSPKVRTVTQLRTRTAAGPVEAPSPVMGFAPGLPAAHRVAVAPRPVVTVTAPPQSVQTTRAPSPASPEANPPGGPTTAPPVPAPTTVPPQPVPTTSPPAPTPTSSASMTAAPRVSTSP